MTSERKPMDILPSLTRAASTADEVPIAKITVEFANGAKFTANTAEVSLFDIMPIRVDDTLGFYQARLGLVDGDRIVGCKMWLGATLRPADGTPGSIYNVTMTMPSASQDPEGTRR